jgi:hypothetical protein
MSQCDILGASMPSRIFTVLLPGNTHWIQFKIWNAMSSSSVFRRPLVSGETESNLLFATAHSDRSDKGEWSG